MYCIHSCNLVEDHDKDKGKRKYIIIILNEKDELSA